jgi:putative DNA primase/helicase
MIDKLKADRKQLSFFVKTLFKYADEGTFVSIRAFHGQSRPWRSREWPSIKLNGADFAPLVDTAITFADRCANAKERPVFCPPVSTFRKPGNAKSENLANGLVLMVECDNAPLAAKQTVEALLGPATLVISSGGIWYDPDTGEAQDKLHLYWRLSCPTRTSEEHVLLYEARKIATRLANADRSAVNSVHPLRWPGSWHLKANPRLCRIIEISDECEIDLEETLEELRAAAEYAGIATRFVGRADISHNLRGCIEDVEAALQLIENHDDEWLEWKTKMLATVGATGGSSEGREAFDRYSAKSDKHDPTYTDDEWEAALRSPPNYIGYRALDMAAGLVDPNWVAPSEEKSIDEDFAQYCSGYYRPTIEVRAGDLLRILNQSEDALISAEIQLYSRGERVVRPITEKVAAAKEESTKTPRLREVSPDDLVSRLAEVAMYKKFDGRSKRLVSADPPRTLATTYLARAGDWRLPGLVGVITTPTLRPDGSILVEPGYDPATGLLLVSPPPMPTISDRPTRKDALVALAALKGLLAEFPFADEPSRSVALSGMITPIARGALPVAPLHGSTAPTYGTGKSYLWDVCAAIAIGDRCPVISTGSREEELEKRLSATLMKGLPIFSIDNVEGPLGGEFLCQAIERPRPEVRILGKSEMIEIDSRTTIYASGNNLRIKGDMVRRTLLALLDAMVEHPELRHFKSNPVATVLADRGRYIAAVLTIVRAYIVAGYPSVLPPFASFEAWSNIVRSALVWLGCADPVETIERTRADDPETSTLRTFMAAWQENVAESQKLTAAELIRILDDELLGQLLPNGVNSRELGKWLQRYAGRIIDGATVCSTLDKKRKVNLWTWTLPPL